MPTLRAVWTRCGAIVRRGPSSIRNAIFARLGIWPVSSLAEHWITDVPTYCINLQCSPERRRRVQAQVDTIGFRHFEFVTAVDARGLTMESVRRDGLYDSAECLKYHPRDLTLNEIACSLSHASVYDRIVERAQPWALVLEDDVLFHTARLAGLRLEDIPPKTDIVFLNAFLDAEPPRDHLNGPVFADTSYKGSSAAYIVSLEAARKLSAASRPVVHAADGLLGRVLRLPRGNSHPFRQRGASIVLTSAIVYPAPVSNGSVEHYHPSAIRTKRG